MPIIVYVDDSGTTGDSSHFVMLGLLSDAQSWDRLNQEWQSLLDCNPRVESFHMIDARRGSHDWKGIPRKKREEKILEFGRILSRHVKEYICIAYEIESFMKTWAQYHGVRPQNDPYFFAFQAVVFGVALELWDNGHRESFEVVFDCNSRLTPNCCVFYREQIEAIKDRGKELKKILPILPADVVGQSSRRFLPLQGADWFAWSMRRLGSGKKLPAFYDKVLDSVPISSNSVYYDEKRLKSILNQHVLTMEKNP